MSKKVLIVDDDRSILDALSLILESADYNVYSTHKGEDTFSAIDSFKPDIILLDVLISGVDGRDICKNLKKNKKYQHIPVIMISAHPSALESSRQAGAQDFLPKPFDMNTLLNTVSNYIS